jgi:hypothetical protein
MPFSRTVPVPLAAILAPNEPIPGAVHERLVDRQVGGVEVDHSAVGDGEFHRRWPIHSQGKHMLYFRWEISPLGELRRSFSIKANRS